MEEFGIFLLFLENKKKLQNRRLVKSLRDYNDPFQMTESIFKQHFRLPKTLCKTLIKELEPYDGQKSKLPFTIRFLSTLYFYAQGSRQKCVGSSYMVGISQSSVCRSLHYITNLIVQRKSNEVKFPQKSEEFSKLKIGFNQNFGIKGTIGAIDCTHVGIIAPSRKNNSNTLSLYMNRKDYYSINVEAICDHQLLFLCANAKFPGSCNDSEIWTTSPARIALLRRYNSQEDTWLLGDQGYPLEPWLLTPVAQPINVKEEKFNKLHGNARNVIERAFGVLKSRFRCLSKHRVLMYSHEKAANIVNACIILHNILTKAGEVEMLPDIELEDDLVIGNITDNYSEGEKIRSRYISTL